MNRKLKTTYRECYIFLNAWQNKSGKQTGNHGRRGDGNHRKEQNRSGIFMKRHVRHCNTCHTALLNHRSWTVIRLVLHAWMRQIVEFKPMFWPTTKFASGLVGTQSKALQLIYRHLHLCGQYSRICGETKPPIHKRCSRRCYYCPGHTALGVGYAQKNSSSDVDFMIKEVYLQNQKQTTKTW